MGGITLSIPQSQPRDFAGTLKQLQDKPSYGSHLDANNFRRNVFRPAAKAAGVPWATPHALRHGMASLMAERGYSPAQIAAHLGHADGGVLALRVYIRTQPIDSPEFVDEALSG